MEKELVRFFVETLKQGKKMNATWNTRAEEEMRELLQARTADEIRETIRQADPDKYWYNPKQLFTGQAPSNSRVKPKVKQREGNLLKDGEFYYHHEIQLLPPPPKCIINDDGSTTWEIEPFYLELKEYYGEDDLHDYFYKTFKGKSIDRPREMGALKFLIDKYGVDTVLYMIDCAYDDCLYNDKQMPRTPIELNEYAFQGMDRLATKQQEALVHGFNKRIPRAM